MKYRLFLIVALMCFSIGAHAQKKHSLNFSVSPYGHAIVNFSKDDEKYHYHFKNFMRGGVEYENSHHGVASLTELTYFRGTYDSENTELKGTLKNEHFNPVTNENMFGASLTQYIGAVINPKGKVQVPFYLGLGTSYINNSSFMHNFTGDIAAKARLKVYFGNVGIFVGGSGRGGFGAKCASKDNGLFITTLMWNVEGGLVVGL